MGESAVKESEERLRYAFRAAGFAWPQQSTVVNLAPADIPKEGTSLDLGIALAILEETRQVQSVSSEPIFAIGELGFDSNLRRCRGALSIGREVPERSVLIAPEDNRYELALLRQIKGALKAFSPHTVVNLSEAADVVRGRSRRLAIAKTEDLKPAWHRGVDFADIKGQARAKRAIEVGAAGGHGVLLIGPPGEGKSLLAKALPTVLPRLTPMEVLELTTIYSARGELASADSVVVHRPFRAIHHTASPASIVGGGSGFPMPGEITLAHRGVLFMDELPEFPPRLLETLRQPMEDGEIHLTRTQGAASYPCEFILVAAMNPCRCGYDEEWTCADCGAPSRYGEKPCTECGSTRRSPRCTCTAAQRQSYRSRISGPIMDRIHLIVRVAPLTADERFSTVRPEDSRTVRKRVEAARELQKRRFGGEQTINGRIPGGQVDRYCELHPSALAAMREVAKRVPEITTRGHDTLLKVSRTVADLNESRQIYKKHIVEAADLCGHEEVREFLSAQADRSSCAGCGEEIDTRDKFCKHCGRGIQ